MNVVEVNNNNFDEIVERSDLLVVDFWATWCGPCKSFNDVILQVSKQFPEVLFGKVDIDQEPKLAEEFEIKSVPSVMIMRKRVIVFAESGALTGTALIDLLKQAKGLDPEALKAKE